MNGTFRLKGLVAEPGTRTCGWIPLLEFSDGTPLNMAISIINGRHQGETVYVGAGAHGDEVTTILAAVDLQNMIQPHLVHGTIVVVPVQNPYGFRHRRRLVNLNETDSETLNLHRAYPGAPDGDLHERMTNRVFSLIKESGASFVFDLHTGNTSSLCPPHTFVPAESFGKPAQESLEAARIFNAGFIIQASSGVYAHGGMPHSILPRDGIPVLGTELGQGGLANSEWVTRGREGIMNVLRHRGVLQDRIIPQAVEQPVLKSVMYARANRGGLLEHLVPAASWVDKGQPIAKIQNLFGELVETIVAPMSGYVITRMVWSTIHEGERVVRIGSPAP